MLYAHKQVVQQLDVRIEQGVFFLTQISSLQRQNTCDVAEYSVRYTNFFNKAWLILNDMILGWAAGSFLAENSEWMSEVTNRFIQSILFQFPREVLYWLDSWPAGLKLNAELSRFYVNTLVGLIDTWESILPLFPPSLFRTLGLVSSIGGLTLLLALFSDTLSFLLTLHLHISYLVTRALFSVFSLRFPTSLLLGVFRGKRFNPLRDWRTDTWEWDMDQLLFGTVLFMLMAFASPTLGVYYCFFAGVRVLGVLSVKAAAEVGVVFLRSFPLFEIMLRAKDAKRLPGGVYFQLSDGYLSLEQSQPIPFSAIFHQYNELRTRLGRHYHPLRLLYRVFKGEHLGSIPMVEMRYEGLSSNANDVRQFKVDS
ncbi:N-acetylglucosaminyl transferase component-domain-containing protein [Crepidotus variabilis]|uniref:N-acetylglucosaminyl transferase component-domain-containing protein n=1 Tax=Crepidotus variabilis TaxID=179855 RepID=A0A9P6EJL6_9AGAR|nr:N-acetylglucosaminyl transferase component-domain-containing protein [Crepidotus variabilis]